MYTIVQPKVTLEWMTPDPLAVIEKAGRTCYQSEPKDDPENFVRMILKRGHDSVLEHVTLSFRIVCDRGCCYSADTEVLTKTGWKAWPDVTSRDEFACLDDDGYLQWHVPSNLYRFEYHDNLLQFATTNLDLLVTPNHNMWVYDYHKRSSAARTWKFIKAEDLKNSIYCMTKTAKWHVRPKSVVVSAHRTEPFKYPRISYSARLTAALFELMGLWITDGSYRVGKSSGSCVQISQTKPNGVRRINELCQELGLRISWYKNEARIDNRRLMAFFEAHFGPGAKTFRAFVPDLIKNSADWQIKRFLDGVILGDGNIHKRNRHVAVYSASSKFCGDLQELFMKIGLSANVRTVKPRERGEICGNKITKCSISYVVSVHCPKTSIAMLKKKSAKAFGSRVKCNGFVYCAEVPHHRLYVRRNGKPVWCGNSHELVRHRIMAYSQESTRYCRYKNGIQVIQPPGLSDEQFAQWNSAIVKTDQVYTTLLDMGMPPQIARSVLPTCLKTEIVATGNLREWRHVLSLRMSKAAHPQMREIMSLLKPLVQPAVLLDGLHFDE